MQKREKRVPRIHEVSMAEVFDMEFHQWIRCEGVSILRVPGGWIYSFFEGQSVFVPHPSSRGTVL